jgi:hypothetical protein
MIVYRFIGTSISPDGKILQTDVQPIMAAAKRALATEKRKAGIKPIKKPKPSR